MTGQEKKAMDVQKKYECDITACSTFSFIPCICLDHQVSFDILILNK